MKKTAIILGLGALACADLGAQDIKFSGLLQVWYNQILDSKMRNLDKDGAKYYNMRSEFKENGFSLRRAEVKLAGKVLEGVNWELMFDPSISTDTKNPLILQDAAVTFDINKQMQVKIGQFRPLQTMEALTSSAELVLIERSQMARTYGDKRDRGAVFAYQITDPADFGCKLSVGIFNGMTDATSGKGNDNNAAKDYVARVDMNLGKAHKFGVYTLQGSTDQKDTTGQAIAPANLPAPYPTQAAIYDNKDKTTHYGVFYSYRENGIIAEGEVMTGLVGRHSGSLNASATPTSLGREHLDQQFLGYCLTGGYTFGQHTVAARYDQMNYNQGDKWYVANNPYPNGSVSYKEATLGYTYAFMPEKVKAANIKVNYIHRSGNALRTSSNQYFGGGTLLGALQVAF